MLKIPNPNFKWQPYLHAISQTFKQYGIHPEVVDKSKVHNTVKKMFLKDTSIGKLINLSFIHHPNKKFTIKFEIDTNPPHGSNEDIKFLEFPLDFSILVQDLHSNFAGKCHALLCRTYIKGRDWYDFIWYVAKKITPNLTFLTNALDQQGPWTKQKINVTPSWLYEVMREKINHVDFEKAKKDVEPFLNTQDKKALVLWGSDFFLDKLNRLDLNQ